MRLDKANRQQVNSSLVLVTTATIPGGVWRHMIDLAEGLKGRGVPLTMAVPCDAVALQADAVARGFSVVELDTLLKRGRGRRVPRSRRLVLHLHLADTFDRRLLEIAARARLRGFRVVITEHLPRNDASSAELSMRPPRPFATVLKTAFKTVEFFLAEKVIAVSSGSRQFLVDRYRLNPAKVVLVHHGLVDAVNPRSRLPAGYDGPMRVACAASVIRQKGIDVLIDAANIAAGDWTALIVGDGPHRELLQSKSAGILTPAGGTRVHFLGWADDVNSLLKKSDVLAVPSRWEASSYSALEAMRAGCAVVASRIDGLEDIVLSGDPSTETGILVDAEDPTALAAALDELSRDAPRCREMGRRGRERMRDQFEASPMIARTIAVLEAAQR